jgi:hypothetical protein
MSDKISIAFQEPKQDRSKKTLDDILEAASNLIDQADPELFTSRILAEESGYSLGTLNKRLISVENAFLWLIKKGQERHVKDISQFISAFDPDLPLQIFVEKLVDAVFTIIKRINPAVIRYYEHRVSLRMGFIENYDRADALVKPLQEASRSNKTGTFREMSDTELRIILRAALSLAERPFVYSDPVAGTREHREIAVRNITLMLGR